MCADIAIQRPQRWDNPFDPEITDAEVERIVAQDLFQGMDTSKFPPTATLRDIVRNDTRINRYRPGDLIVRTGDYGTTAFYIISGSVRVVLPPNNLPDSILGRGRIHKRSIVDALSQLWRNPKVPEARNPSLYLNGTRTGVQRLEDREGHTYIRDVPAILERYQTAQLQVGAMFGEIAALTRSARTTTIFAEDDVELLEIRRQGVRDIYRRVGSFRKRVDALYRRNTLKKHLSETPLFRNLSDEVIDKIASETLFETYGDFDWHISYNKYLQRSSAERLAMEPIIVNEGDYPDGLLMIVSGSARVSRQFNHGHVTLSYTGVGAVFGLEEIVHNWRNGTDLAVPFQNSLRSVGYTDLLRVPTAIVEEHVLPSLPPSLLPPPVERRQTSRTGGAVSGIGAHTLEVLVENRFNNGTATMLIDLDRCVRCDACVDACAKGHNSNPRFVRHGRTFDHYMVANACMHCADPVCMIGCPTGAIHRNPQGGQVVINDATCIGCATCATNCPYDNIRMVEIRDKAGAFILDSATNTPIVKATKCDLCVDQLGGPACQRACPHDALVRLNLQDRGALARWFGRR